MQLRSDQSTSLSSNASGVSVRSRRHSIDPLEGEWDEFVIRFDREKGQFNVRTTKTDRHSDVADPAENAKKAA